MVIGHLQLEKKLTPSDFMRTCLLLSNHK